MCWSARVSLNTYIVALFGTIFALANGVSPQLVLFMHWFSLIQLVEFFIWRNINNEYWNFVFSTIGIGVIFVEPLLSMSFMSPGLARNLLAAAYILFCLVLVLPQIPWRPHSIKAANGHLKWKWMPFTNSYTTKMILLIWSVFFLIPLVYAKMWQALMLGSLILLISTAAYMRGGTIASMWCWLANFAWLILIAAVALDKCVFYCKPT